MWWLKTMKESGLIKEYGISLIRPEDGFEAINKYEFPIIEVNYNLMDRRAETTGLFDLCLARKVKTIIRTPLAQGILSGKFQFSEDSADRRNSWSPEYVNRITKTYKSMLDSLNGNSYTDAQNCLRFCLSHPAVCTIIPGMKKVEEVVENISTLNFPKLTTEEHKKLMDIYIKEI